MEPEEERNVDYSVESYLERFITRLEMPRERDVSVDMIAICILIACSRIPSSVISTDGICAR